jgi:prepilin signal peptidase PulO-like enzyme (type II secretory pathway)
MSSTVSYDRDVDLTDVSHIARSAIKIGLFTAVTVLLFSLVSRFTGGAVESILGTLIVVVGIFVVTFLPGLWTNPRTIEGIAGAAGIGLGGAVVYLLIDVVLLQKIGTYSNRWRAIGGGSNWWYHPVCVDGRRVPAVDGGIHPVEPGGARRRIGGQGRWAGRRARARLRRPRRHPACTARGLGPRHLRGGRPARARRPPRPSPGWGRAGADVKVLRVFARILGWLLTPLVALAASFLGATLSATLLANDEDPRRALILSFAGAAIFAVCVAWLWLRLLRHAPHVREALSLDEEGLPTGDIFEPTSTAARGAAAGAGNHAVTWRVTAVACALALTACGERKSDTAPPSMPAAPTDSLALTAPGGIEVWYIGARTGRDSTGTTCIERAMEIRRDGASPHSAALHRRRTHARQRLHAARAPLAQLPAHAALRGEPAHGPPHPAVSRSIARPALLMLVLGTVACGPSLPPAAPAPSPEAGPTVDVPGRHKPSATYPESPERTLGPGLPAGEAEALGRSIVGTAREAMGRPYRYGGRGADGGGFDCSGLIQFAYASTASRCHASAWTRHAPASASRARSNSCCPGTC